MNYRVIIPNMFTSANLVFGMCSIISTYSGNIFWGAVFILLALMADGMDGRTARFFGVSSEMGKEMDSLCDCVSFGAAPGFLAYAFVLHNFGLLGWVCVIIYAVCGMWRLARFNVNASVIHGYFMGVPIPAGGCLIATWVLLSTAINITPQIQIEALGYALPVLILIDGYLLVSTFKYPDFKGKGEKISKVALIIVAVFAVCVLYFGREAIGYAILFDIFISYALLGILNTVFTFFGRN